MIESMAERLQKLLARAGYGSRREIETWISDGRLTINGETASVGVQADTTDTITLDGKPLGLHAIAEFKPRALLYHKPVGEICSRSDPEGRKSVMEKIPKMQRGRWVMVGRLDINTSGLLLFVNDGELANRLMHPSYEIQRRYAVRILGETDDNMLQRLRDGVQLDDGDAAFEEIYDAGGEGANHWYHVTLREGRKREVRRLWESQGVKVSRLIRISYANIELPPRLPLGKWVELSPSELKALYETVKLAFPERPQTGLTKSPATKRRRAPAFKTKPAQRGRGRR